jgi:hypothetical protein
MIISIALTRVRRGTLRRGFLEVLTQTPALKEAVRAVTCGEAA